MKNMTTTQAARMLGVGVSTVQRWVDLGILKSTVTIGGHRRISLAVIDNFLREKTVVVNSDDDSTSPTFASLGNYQNALVVQDEIERVKAVKATNLLDTPREPRFDRIARLASEFAQTPIAAIGLLDHDRLWIKSSIGVEPVEISRSTTFCTYTIGSDSPLMVEDAMRDSRFSNNPHVVGHPSVRFYAGFALHDKLGYRLGTLCISDQQPRILEKRIVWALKELTALASEEIQRYTEASLANLKKVSL